MRDTLRVVRELPRGTVTLLFTDIEGSTRLLQELGRDRYVEALTIHRELLREAFMRHRGVEVEMQGDSFHFSFETARQAVEAAAAGQRALASYEWPTEPIRVRIGLHTGEPVVADDLYAGLDVHRAARVMSAAHGGQVLLSARTVDLIAEEPPEGLSVRDLGEHRLKDLLEPQRLYQLAGEGLAEEFPPPKTLPTATTNLPVVSTPLIGRDRELEELLELLARDDVRVLTLTGPGGIGKTRLALQAAAETIERFEGGVFWVPVAALRDPELVLPSIEQALGAQGELAEQLRGRGTLVLLDNVEQLLEAAGPLAELLAEARELRLLVTSRSPLRIAGEHEYPVDPLPDEGAVALLLDRARQAGARLEASQAVHEICRRLDNLPLALELAAGRAKLLGADALLARLERRLPVLTGGRRDLPERQRTLRATIEWSYELLADEAKELFARLSVFAGAFALEAAEDVCGAGLDVLAELVDLSLLKPVGEGRFLMLETIREYAAEQLDRLDETQAVRDRHARFYLALAEEAEGRTYEHGQADLFESLERERGNFLAALDYFADAAPEVEVQFAGALQDYWISRGYVAEGRSRLEAALSRAPGAPPEARARALEGAAWVAAQQSDYEAAERHGTDCLAVARTTGDQTRVGSALRLLGVVDVHRQRYGRARALFGEAIEIARSTGDDVGLAHTLGNVSDLALYEGAFDEAARAARECLEVAEAQGDSWTAAVALINLGLALVHVGEEAEALRNLVRAVDLALQIGARLVLCSAIETVAAATAGRAPEATARLVGAAQAGLHEMTTPLPPFESRVHKHTLELLEEQLGAGEVERLLGEGAEVELEQAAMHARELVAGVAPSPQW